MQHDQTKHIKIDKYFIKEKLDSGLICTSYVSTNRQLANILTKGLSSTTFQVSVSKLGMKNICSLTRGGMWKNVIRKYYNCIFL